MLTGLDHVAGGCPNVLFVATTNFQEAVDEAFISRVDLLEHLGPPSAAVIESILRDTLGAVAPALVSEHGADSPVLAEIAVRLADGHVDGRQVRKLVMRALTGADAGLALGERDLSWEDLRAIAESDAVGNIPDLSTRTATLLLLQERCSNGNVRDPDADREPPA